MRIASVQMPIADGDPQRNREVLSGLLDGTARADLYLIPELWSSGYVQQRWGELADRDTPVALEWMGAQAARLRAWLGGTLVVRDAGGRLRNRFVLFDRSGVPAFHYDKAHLFVPMDEHRWLAPGELLSPLVEIEGVKVAAGICYDLRFPEMFRRLTLAGAELFLVPAEWPKPRQHALRVMAEARAVENQAILVLANRIGPDINGVEFCGGSGVFGPFGPLADAGEEHRVVSADVNVGELRELRNAFPVLSHRLRGIDFD